jgi:transposase InsO family protein
VARAETRREDREVRSFEAPYVNGLWHLDFHTGSLRVLRPQGQWVYPSLVGVIDDHSRLACHTQWYCGETAEDLVHGLSQAFCKRGLPRSLLTDNGAAMTAAEVAQGLKRLSIVHDTTLPYSAYQNGKQEVFWATVEGRLMAMLHGVNPLTLELLNEATQAWVEMEYNRTKHSETRQAPLDRFLNGKNVGRASVSSEALAQAFRQDVTRTQRRSDGTITLDAVRFEIPGRFAHLRRLTVRYARWNLRHVHLVDPRTDTLLAPIYPLDKTGNADGRRRRLPSPPVTPTHTTDQSSPQMAPLLRKLVAQYAATGLPPAYVPTPHSTGATPEIRP